MKTGNKILVLLLLAICQMGNAQGFINLNFESTTLITNGSPGTVSTTIGLPDWNAFIGGISQSTILYNNGTLGNSAIAILGYGNPLNPVIAGNFSVSLTAGANGNAAISQTGVVPQNVYSILFESYAQGNELTNLLVTLNGQAINIMPLETTANYTLYGGNISSFSGQTADLTFTASSTFLIGKSLEVKFSGGAYDTRKSVSADIGAG